MTLLVVAAHFLLADEGVHARVVIDLQEPSLQIFVYKDVEAEDLKRCTGIFGALLCICWILLIGIHMYHIRDGGHGFCTRVENVFLNLRHDRLIFRPLSNFFK